MKIPNDITAAARRRYDGLGRGSVSDSEHIARAILAERRRCADAARKYLKGYTDVADDILQAIEAGA